MIERIEEGALQLLSWEKISWTYHPYFHSIKRHLYDMIRSTNFKINKVITFLSKIIFTLFLNYILKDK